MSSTGKLKPLAMRDGINPKTGRRWTLADPQVKAELDSEIEAMKKDPSKALSFLREVGILTPSNKLSSKYGGR